jgi:hypothetical protein
MGVGGYLGWLVYDSGCCVSGALGLGSQGSAGLVWCGC